MTTSIDEPIKPLKVISASAGTGKTFRLSQEYINALKRNEGQTQKEIIATTFTNKAAAELMERVRRALLQDGQWEAAQEVLSGYLGTVNAICGRLLSEHAIEAGFSPDFSVIGEEQNAPIFAIAVDNVIRDFADQVDSGALRLQLDWRKDVHEIINLARNNDLGAKLLLDFAEQSWQRLNQLLPGLNGEETEASLDANLASAVDAVLQQLQTGDDLGDRTVQAVEFLRDVSRNLNAGRVLNWQVWAKLARLPVNNLSASVIKRVQEAAAAHTRHPRLHGDLQNNIFGVFRCAAAALQEYSRYKREHGLIDFVDQEHLALRILQLPAVRAGFRESMGVLLVDEFQDTSPIQLAVFLEMARLVNYSVWVGDEKQSIFGFRGSDPELMREAVEQLVGSNGARRYRLKRSFRSRPSLVHFANELFVRAAPLMNIPAASAIVDEIEREEIAEQNDPLHLWWLQEGRNEKAQIALAQSVAHVLANAEAWKVVDRHSKELRPIRGSDIAVLCRSNWSRIAVAKALSAQGLTVATERNNLLDTPECMLAFAALRLLVDEDDSLALAELANLLRLSSQDEWLNSWLTSGREAVEQELPCVAALADARASLIDRTPSELLELAIACGGVMEKAAAWGNVRQRLANLDALRGLAKAFEELCLSSRIPCTAGGLLLYLQKQVRDGGNQPANPDENGIHILTYHKSKGLEWPLVVLYDLDTPGRGSPFGIAVESPEEGLDPLQPLKARSIRYWPWPYGNQRADIALDQSVARTSEARQARLRTTAENLRLLYVGITRARDYLILAAQPTRTKTRSGTAWLDTIVDHDGEKILNLPFPEKPTAYVNLLDGVAASQAKIEIKQINKDAINSSQNSQEVYMAPEASESLTGEDLPLSFSLSPSAATEADFEVSQHQAPETLIIGERIPFSGTPDMQTLGDCVHAFLCVDDHSESSESRSFRASTILKNWSILAIQPADLLLAADRLDAFLEATYPAAIRHAEMPIAGRLGLRRVAGTVDLLLELPDSYVIIDHKSFPGRFDQWHKQALIYQRQMALYRTLVEQVTDKPVSAQYIHMPIVGAMVKIDCSVGNIAVPAL